MLGDSPGTTSASDMSGIGASYLLNAVPSKATSEKLENFLSSVRYVAKNCPKMSATVTGNPVSAFAPAFSNISVKYAVWLPVGPAA